MRGHRMSGWKQGGEAINRETVVQSLLLDSIFQTRSEDELYENEPKYYF